MISETLLNEKNQGIKLCASVHEYLCKNWMKHIGVCLHLPSLFSQEGNWS